MPRKPPKISLDVVRRHLVDLRRSEHAERPPVLALRRLVAEVKSPGGPIAWLAAYDPEAYVHEAAGMMLFLVAQDPTVPPGLRRTIGRAAAPWLLRAMQDPGVSDERKYVIGPLLGLCGVDLSESDYRACFRDLDQVHRGKSREAMRQILDRPEHVERLLLGLGVLGEDGDGSDQDAALQALDLAVAMLEHNPPVAALMAGTCAVVAQARGAPPERMGAALEEVASSRTPRAAWVLDELGRLPGLGGLGEAARALCRSLAEVGVAPLPPAQGPFSHGWVSGVDGAGSQTATLFRRSGEGTLHALTLHLDDEGVQDAWCVFDSGDHLDDQLRASTLPGAPCDPELARELLGGALAAHAEHDRPPPARLLLFRAFLGPEPIVVGPRAPRLGTYLLETIVPSPSLVDGSDALLEHPIYGDLWWATPAAYALVERSLPRGRSRKLGAARREVVALAMALEWGAERRALERRVAGNLETEARAGRSRRPVNRLAARTWLGLTEGVVPFEDVPYVQALCRRAVSAIEGNLRAGYTSQKEANAARLELDARARRTLERFGEEADLDDYSGDGLPGSGRK